MRRALIAVLAGCLSAYVLGWVLAFMVFVGNHHLVGQYVVWSWTGGGERAAYLQVFAVIAAGMGGLGGLLWSLYRGTKNTRGSG